MSYQQGEGYYYEDRQQQQQGGQYDQEDYDNLEAIERELEGSGGYEEEDAMDELEREMDKAVIKTTGDVAASGGGAFLPAGAVPSKNGVLSPHAAEFWFPECRNCPCCKGFKHGCPCRSPAVDSCTHAECIDQVYKTSVTNNLALRPEVPSPTASSSAPSASPARAVASHSPSSPASYGGGPVCKFFLSGGCQFGASCRFVHPNNGGGLPSPPSQSGGPQICIFFSKGQCNKGTACRFAHA